MSEPRADFAILGGGLAGGLIALALRRADPAQRWAAITAGAGSKAICPKLARP